MLHALDNRFLRTPNVKVCEVDPGKPESFAQFQDEFDTVVCLNVLEFEEHPEETVAAIRRVLHPGAKLVILVPHKQALFGSVDKPLGHRRRFERRAVAEMVEAAGLEVVHARDFNRIGALSWWIYGKLLGWKRISKVTLKLFDKSVWFWRKLDRLMLWPGLSLIVVAQLPAFARPSGDTDKQVPQTAEPVG
jgi:SAM-dependent methyltransferase